MLSISAFLSLSPSLAPSFSGCPPYLFLSQSLLFPILSPPHPFRLLRLDCFAGWESLNQSLRLIFSKSGVYACVWQPICVRMADACVFVCVPVSVHMADVCVIVCVHMAGVCLLVCVLVHERKADVCVLVCVHMADVCLLVYLFVCVRMVAVCVLVCVPLAAPEKCLPVCVGIAFQSEALSE